jgi:predicted nucleic acid-binding protein
MRYFYLDTSALAKRYSPEAGSENVDSIIAGKDSVIVIGNIAVTEMYSAPSKKLRTGEISPQDMLSAVYRFEKDMSENAYHFLEIDNDIITASKQLILAHPGLRAYDALHLALALELSELDPTVVTSDEMLLETAAAEGLKVVDPARE